MSKLYMVHISEDGDVRVREIAAAELPEYADEGWLSAEQLREYRDPNNWPARCLLIKGEVVVPKPKQTVTEYEIP